MMKTYRADPRRARLGGLIASGLVGGGLLLTASGGIAAETSRQVEQEVRTALAPIVPALAPEAPLPPPAPVAPEAPGAPALPEAVKLAMLHPHPDPVPPVAAMPPAPPVPPAPPRPAVRIDINRDEIAREVRESVEEARREAAEARREALLEAAEARREAAEAAREDANARREAERARELAAYARSEGARARAEAARVRAEAVRVRAGVRINTSDYCGSAGARVHISDSGDKTVTCLGWSEKDKAEMRKTMLVSLKSARVSIASMDHRHMPERARAQALESIDRQIERLRSSN